MATLTRCMVVLGLAGALGGCAEVAAYERETLATQRMALDPDAGESQLVLTRRTIREEGLIGVSGAGTVSGGGGCGCQ